MSESASHDEEKKVPEGKREKKRVGVLGGLAGPVMRRQPAVLLWWLLDDDGQKRPPLTVVGVGLPLGEFPFFFLLSFFSVSVGS